MDIVYEIRDNLPPVLYPVIIEYADARILDMLEACKRAEHKVKKDIIDWMLNRQTMMRVVERNGWFYGVVEFGHTS